MEAAREEVETAAVKVTVATEAEEMGTAAMGGVEAADAGRVAVKVTAVMPVVAKVAVPTEMVMKVEVARVESRVAEKVEARVVVQEVVAVARIPRKRTPRRSTAHGLALGER